MTDLWLPPGALPFDEDIERVIAESDDPAETRRGARRMSGRESPFPARPIAALYVMKGGAYYGLDGVDPWDEERDARRYDGPHPVVAHPPCARWCRLAGLVETRWGHKRGDDGGCFEAALRAVRSFGGVLEHPAYSDAWDAFGLPEPLTVAGWTGGTCGGWSCYVEQHRYGHPARKATWLYAYGVELTDLEWGYVHDHKAGALVSWCGNHTSIWDKRDRVGKAAAAATPPAFRDVLLAMARSAAVPSGTVSR